MVTAIAVTAMIVAVISIWRVPNWLWLTPKKLEKLLREQGFQGNPYRILVGDTEDIQKMLKQSQSKPMDVSDDDILHRFLCHIQQNINRYGKKSFIWFGPKPRVIITDPELIKDALNKVHNIQKPHSNPLIRLLASGLVSHEGEKWSKHRRIINPTFTSENIKIMMPAFLKSCTDMINKWQGMLSSDGSCEIDVWPFLQALTSDVISRSAFGSSYEEGIRIFDLQKEQAQLAMKLMMKIYIPGWRFVPTKINRRMKEIDRDIRNSLKVMINNREKALKAGEANKNNDLLGILLESNHKEIHDHGGNKKNIGMNLEDVIEEYSDWQARAREEVLQVFGNQTPNFEGLSHLKIVTMIFYEVLRLYPPIISLVRHTHKDIKLGNLILPAGVQLSFPILYVHRDPQLWGDNAKEFNPARFSEGVSKATNGKVSFFPFGWGPRIYIGQNFAIVEAKLALSFILQNFWFELSPSYTHAPANMITLRPQYGAHIILHKVQKT
ncbi:hypothetical protein PIB30_031828 [Stylosanthes scabra]|uniref:11-oxo-beta-amyrin 30-oxidase n=1 Tax=Stylosanthes scabra TaxID=79078 RepID=A0ABU6RC98_9FABA|nr:hypothetical protein [Stylosanthes scabra]